MSLLALLGPLLISALIQEADDGSKDLRGIAVSAVLILPFAGLKLAFHIDEAALAQIPAHVLGGLAEARYAMPLRFLDALARVPVRIGLVSGDREIADRAALPLPDLGIPA